jgi:electron transfer flavoprotein alpha subunit
MILVYIESNNGQLKKASLEVLTYGKKLSDQTGTPLGAISLTETDSTLVGEYGASKLFQASDVRFKTFDSKAFAKAISEIFKANGGTVLILPFNQNGKALAPRLSVRLEAGLVNGANAMVNTSNGFTVSKNVFSGKAVANYQIHTAIKIVSVASNSIPSEKSPTSCQIIPVTTSLTDTDFTVKFIKNELVSGDIPLSEADLVVSGGRGLKGPENWGMLEELASVLGAATACSKPVSDIGWRPHSEHVGQTGKPVASNLYIAVGISGAIQHIAGINSSKVKVVINTDAEAPFFKVADYGIVGDALEILPRLTAKLKEFKANN